MYKREESPTKSFCNVILSRNVLLFASLSTCLVQISMYAMSHNSSNFISINHSVCNTLKQINVSKSVSRDISAPGNTMEENLHERHYALNVICVLSSHCWVTLCSWSTFSLIFRQCKCLVSLVAHWISNDYIGPLKYNPNINGGLMQLEHYS